ncbi:MerR family transcriptional regulator [candidate division TA06 bacterium]|uniref:MerR family transcriptional regulator n=1 Tax=candidate division TA06 bacterium TaxID=2250710 RepID=A0A523UZ16_UNCT6|nr:MAG: MerR family transcriptional regulator [candidate division TA06 bacterium]
MAISQTPKRLYYSISDVSEMVGVKPHVLRYWESEFSLLKPKKSKAGRRTYTQKEIKLILLIKKLLYEQRFTLEGAKNRIHELKKAKFHQLEIPFDQRLISEFIKDIRKDLEEILQVLCKE